MRPSDLGRLEKGLKAQNESNNYLVSSPLDDLCIDIWISVMISQNPDDKETGYSNVLTTTCTLPKGPAMHGEHSG